MKKILLSSCFSLSLMPWLAHAAPFTCQPTLPKAEMDYRLYASMNTLINTPGLQDNLNFIKMDIDATPLIAAQDGYAKIIATCVYGKGDFLVKSSKPLYNLVLTAKSELKVTVSNFVVSTATDPAGATKHYSCVDTVDNCSVIYNN